MAQLAMVAWAFAFAAGHWAVRVVLAGMLVDLVLLPIHQAGLARLQAAGLRRHVDRDGVRLEGSAPRVGIDRTDRPRASSAHRPQEERHDRDRLPQPAGDR